MWAASGRPLAEFWTLTFREVAYALEGAADARLGAYTDQATALYLHAQLARAKKLPPLRKVLPQERTRRKQPKPSGELLEIAKMWTAATAAAGPRRK